MDAICEVPIVDTGCFPIDTTLQLQGSFIATLTGQLLDPTAIFLFLTPPSGPQQEINFSSGGLTRVSAGIYTYVFTPTLSGTWVGTWQGTGLVMATRDFSFLVQPSGNIVG